MNPILQIKLSFKNENNPQKSAGRNLGSHDEVTIQKIEDILNSLYSVIRYYDNVPKYLNKMLIDVNYNRIIPKSYRIQALLKPKRLSVNDTIVGARFSNAPEGEETHIITYYVDIETIKDTISVLNEAKKFLSDQLNGKAIPKNFNNNDKLQYSIYNLSKTALRNAIIDCSVINNFSIPRAFIPETNKPLLVTFYKTELSISSIFEKLNIDERMFPYTFYGNDTISSNRNLIELLSERIPYMISMISGDLAKLSIPEIVRNEKKEDIDIPDPKNEPTIGVIDTLFDESVYFNKWVKNTNWLDDVEKLSLPENVNREHGTEVSSIIVDGPRLNPWLDDGCGRFRVRHFGVCEAKISTARLIRKVKDIINNNPDIHVWNLSLGTEEEISKNFISYDSSILDEIQAQKNVIFVISGTNDNRNQRNQTSDKLRIGAPADSLNSIVVNSVTRDGKESSYSRKGNVLSFYNKPDVSYYGGDYDERIKAYSPYYGEQGVYGTSFAAPWISRKLCYLIDIMGFPREVAKALIIDSAAGWEYKKSTFKKQKLVGYGIVPIRIKEILSTDNEEIRFMLYGTSKSYKTSNYGIPIPRDEDGNYPYIARATLCYFPKCTRSQGVDYTNRELSIQFGRIKENGAICDINENTQDEAGSYVTESKSRKDFRKWENTKFISNILKKNRPIKSYGERLWGLVLASKERLDSKTKNDLNFGVIITLKEIKGINRIDDFIKACTLRGMIVNEIDVKNHLELYNKNQEEIVFED